MSFHGIENDDDSAPSGFRFGILRLAHVMSNFKGIDGVAPPDWTKRWHTRRFHQATMKLQDTFWKFDRAAGHINRCREAIHRGAMRDAEDNKRQHPMDDVFHDYISALQDIPLFLDSMLFYLRIQVDAYAVIVPFFYQAPNGIARRSFRKQIKWFLRRESADFDPGYTAILQENLGWFDELAGKNPSGLRDVIVHQGGTYQLGWAAPSADKSLELRAMLLDSSGSIEEDLINALTRITTGWFRFLDLSWSHFSDRLNNLVGLHVDKLQTRLTECGGQSLPSFWVYPNAT